MKKSERETMLKLKKQAKEKAEKKLAEKLSRKRGELDEWGYGVNSKTHKFIESIQKAPKTMAQIQKEKWNDKGAVFTKRFAELKKKGLADRTKDGKMFFTGRVEKKKAKKK